MQIFQGPKSSIRQEPSVPTYFGMLKLATLPFLELSNIKIRIDWFISIITIKVRLYKTFDWPDFIEFYRAGFGLFCLLLGRFECMKNWSLRFFDLYQENFPTYQAFQKSRFSLLQHSDSKTGAFYENTKIDKVQLFWEGHKILRNFTLLLTGTRTKVRWRFRKILWPSQNIWTLKDSLLSF